MTYELLVWPVPIRVKPYVVEVEDIWWRVSCGGDARQNTQPQLLIVTLITSILYLSTLLSAQYILRTICVEDQRKNGKQ